MQRPGSALEAVGTARPSLQAERECRLRGLQEEEWPGLREAEEVGRGGRQTGPAGPSLEGRGRSTLKELGSPQQGSGTFSLTGSI